MIFEKCQNGTGLCEPHLCIRLLVVRVLLSFPAVANVGAYLPLETSASAADAADVDLACCAHSIREDAITALRKKLQQDSPLVEAISWSPSDILRE